MLHSPSLAKILSWRKPYLPYVCVAMFAEWIKVISHGALEQCRLLWNDSKLGPKILQPNRADIKTINNHTPSGWFDQPEQGLNKSGLSASCSSYNTNFFSIPDIQGDPLQNQRSIRSIAQLRFPTDQNGCVRVLFLSVYSTLMYRNYVTRMTIIRQSSTRTLSLPF